MELDLTATFKAGFFINLVRQKSFTRRQGTAPAYKEQKTLRLTFSRLP